MVRHARSGFNPGPFLVRAMSTLSRLLFALLFAAGALPPAAAKTSTQESEYKADAGLYWRNDVVKSDPTVKIFTADDFVKKGDSWFMLTHGQPPKEVYIEETQDWIEPITPPTMPTSLGIAPDAMQIREPRGDVEVALPGSPTTFSPAQDSVAIPNGSIVKTGANSTAAVLFGGVNSARLLPNSEAVVSQTVTPTLRTTLVDLKSGAVFSKVGTREGDPQKQDYEVHTFNGNAAAKGTDFVTVALPLRTDVWVAQGTVELIDAGGRVLDSVTGDGTGALKVERLPLLDDAVRAMTADEESLTIILNFIPTANIKLKALREALANGARPTANEKAYLKRIKKVSSLMRLTLVEPPPPPPPPPLASAPVKLRKLSIAEPTIELKLPAPPKLDTRPIPSPAPGASPTPLPPPVALETAVAARGPAPADNPAPETPAPAPPMPTEVETPASDIVPPAPLSKSVKTDATPDVMAVRTQEAPAVKSPPVPFSEHAAEKDETMTLPPPFVYPTPTSDAEKKAHHKKKKTSTSTDSSSTTGSSASP
jgi:hypothetical protein